MRPGTARIAWGGPGFRVEVFKVGCLMLAQLDMRF